MIHRYRVYYDFNGPTKSDPLRTPKTEQQISDALDGVGFELSIHLNDNSVEITASPVEKGAITLTVETAKTDSFSQALKKCLNGLDLFASKIA